MSVNIALIELNMQRIDVWLKQDQAAIKSFEERIEQEVARLTTCDDYAGCSESGSLYVDLCHGLRAAKQRYADRQELVERLYKVAEQTRRDYYEAAAQQAQKGKK